MPECARLFLNLGRQAAKRRRDTNGQPVQPLDSATNILLDQPTLNHSSEPWLDPFGVYGEVPYRQTARTFRRRTIAECQQTELLRHVRRCGYERQRTSGEDRSRWLATELSNHAFSDEDVHCGNFYTSDRHHRFPEAQKNWQIGIGLFRRSNPGKSRICASNMDAINNTSHSCDTYQGSSGLEVLLRPGIEAL